MARTRVKVVLLLENDEQGNTWWSNGHPPEASIQLHVDHAVYVALGKPEMVMVEVEGVEGR